MHDGSGYCIVMTTAGDVAKAKELAEGLVSAKLAACVQMQDIRSVYTWQGALEKTAEVLLLIKTRVALYGRVEAFITDRHDYDVPEILAVPVLAGSPAYLAWLHECTS